MTTQDPEESQEEESDASPAAEDRPRVARRRGRSRARLQESLQRVEAQRRVLVAAVTVLGVAVAVLGVWGNGALREVGALRAELSRAQREETSLGERLAASEATLLESKRAVEALVADRIPGLMELRVGEILDVGLPPVRRAGFEVADSERLEAKLLVENETDRATNPILTITLFGEVGTEVARAEVTDGSQSLRPGEIRTFFATLALPEGEEPRYFRVTSK